MNSLFSKNIAVIGTGNLAFHICNVLKKEGFNLQLIIGRNKTKVAEIGKKFKVSYTNQISLIPENIDLIFVCVKDDAVEEVIKSIKTDVSNRIIIHTSGSLAIDVIKKKTKNAGVFYPVFSFNKNRNVNFKKIPVLIETSKGKAQQTISKMAQIITDNVISVNSEQRKKIHLAAVISNNFVNYLYTVAEDFLKENKLPFNLLVPLITDAALRLQDNQPSKMQTGPALRGDKNILNKHLEMLKNKEIIKIYTLLSKQIKARHHQ